jgi:hypothetical protein
MNDDVTAFDILLEQSERVAPARLKGLLDLDLDIEPLSFLRSASR